MLDKLKSRRALLRMLGIAFVFFLVTGAILAYRIHRQLPPGMMKDIQAGIAARHIQDADQRFEKYLDLRFGPQSDPANRQKAFLAFFDRDHIRALQLLVQHSPENMRAANIAATARWVEKYRQSLAPGQRADLSARLQSADGQAMLRTATAQYNSQDVQYRGQTAPVISQLLTTIASVQKK